MATPPAKVALAPVPMAVASALAEEPLPKAVALPENVKRVEVIAVGRTRIITPAGETWDEWFDGHNVSADFMDNREQPGMQERESF